MNTTNRDLIMQRWNVIQNELLPELKQTVGALTPKLEKVIHLLEWVRIEEFVVESWCGVGRPPHERATASGGPIGLSVHQPLFRSR